ncbi:MAG: hypothetical protein ACT6FD_07775 [Methanosarcinaceae archaeon]
MQNIEKTILSILKKFEVLDDYEKRPIYRLFTSGKGRGSMHWCICTGMIGKRWLR